MVLWTTAFDYCLRSFFPVALSAMLDRNKTVHVENGTLIFRNAPDYGPKFSWTFFQEGQLIGAYFYGYSITSLPAGCIAEHFGPYWTVLVRSLISAVITQLSALADIESWVPLYICRLLVGLSAVKPPIWKMLKCVPFIVLVLGHFGVVSGLFFVVVLLPKFFDEALNFDLIKTGEYSAFPSIGRVVAGSFYAGLAGYLTKKYSFDKKYLRKGLVVFSHLLPGVLLMTFLLNFSFEFGENLVIGILVTSTICTSAAMVTTTINPQDLAPNFAGTQIGIMTLFGSTSGFIYPTILVHLTKEKSDLPQWSILLSIIGGIYLVTGFLFIIFGSASLQSWNQKSEVQLIS